MLTARDTRVTSRNSALALVVFENRLHLDPVGSACHRPVMTEDEIERELLALVDVGTLSLGIGADGAFLFWMNEPVAWEHPL